MQKSVSNSSTDHSFKPVLIRHNHTIYTFPKGDFKQRYYKYITNLKITRGQEAFTWKIKRIKQLRTFDLEQYGYTGRLRDSQLIKSVKPFTKFIRKVDGDLKAYCVQKHLPKLADVRLDVNRENWRIMLTRFEYKSLVIKSHIYQFLSYQEGNDLMLGLLKRYKSRITRMLCKARNLKILKIDLGKFYKELLIILLQILDKQSSILGSLDVFTLKVWQALEQGTEEIEIKRGQDLGQCLKYVTNLQMKDMRWHGSPLSLDSFKNLTQLELEVSTEDDYRQLSLLEKLEKVNRLDLKITVESVEDQEEFFENFSLPRAVEYLSFTMGDFRWRDLEQSQNFLKKWKGLNRLKALNFIINDMEDLGGDSKISGDFIAAILQQLDTLEELNYVHTMKENYSFLALEKEPLNLKEFWQALKENLQILSIHAPKIGFPCKIWELSTEKLMSLEKICIKGEIVWDSEGISSWIGSFEKIKEIELDRVVINDEERLGMFLDDVKNIKKDVTLRLCVNVNGLDGDVFVRSLEEKIDEKRIEGDLMISFKRVNIQESWKLDNVKEKVLRNGSFKLFEVACYNWSSSFTVKKSVIETKVRTYF